MWFLFFKLAENIVLCCFASNSQWWILQWCNINIYAGRVLLMLGKLQFKLGKLVDNYVSLGCICKMEKKKKGLFSLSFFKWLFCLFQRGHIIKTITTPSESLMNELQTVEVCSYESLQVYIDGMHRLIIQKYFMHVSNHP